MFFKFLLLACSLGLFFYLVARVDRVTYRNLTVLKLKSHKPSFFRSWSSCAHREFLDESDTPNEFWINFKNRSIKCDQEAEVGKFMKIVGINNSDETKHVVYPAGKHAETVFVTLGIGLDIEAELKFQQEMNRTRQNVTFYGADPIVPGNSELFSRIGQYFPFAVGGTAGFSSASVLVNGAYMNLPVAHIDIYYFLNNVLKHKNIDYLWMDTEYAEYETLEMFYKHGPLDKLGITFCQMNLEVHSADAGQKQQFQTFLRRIVEEQRYGFFRNDNVGHIRMWLFNFGSDYCARKFLWK